MFRIKMGVAGVGVPEETFGVSCVPYPGNEHDLHATEPWRHPRAVQLVNTKTDTFNLDVECYNYDPTPNDTVAAIADAFELDIRKLLADNKALFG
jgi:hypothetical protein